MADSYIINVKPTISQSDGRKMENDLNKRFSRVAKKFGGALKTVGSKLKSVIAGGAVAGITAMVANPIENLNQSMDETLRRYDDLNSRAKQLGVSSGQLYQATAIAQSAGIEPDDFRSILTAYAVKLGEARKGEDTMLAEFVDEENIITGFFKMLKSLQGLEASERMYFASKIIGEDDSAKLAELINTDLLERQRELFGNISPEDSTKEIEIITKPDKNISDNDNKKNRTASEQITQAIQRLSNVEERQAVLRGQRDLNDLIVKSQSITNETVNLQNELLKKQDEVENAQLKTYEAFVKMQLATEESKRILAEMQASIAPAVEKGVGIAEDMFNWLKNSKFGKWAGGIFK